ncbi:MmcQ/YjbR family DNA-binding protein [Candidatus Saccharibacteria bacterium]|nr:MmcQ/YjbR family DNA-binding protein [Candidatus Saccharibacteria bacterium]MCL1963130.1 MmcQ/YjbR family DNA-binding protein [Candidatus Saccharibacteria bacterium]
MTHKEIEEFILQMPNARLDYPFGETTAVYRAANDKMFVLIAEGSNPLRISLKVDPQLGQLLRDKYESVMPGWHLNKKHWITVLATGQLSDQEIRDLVRHSFELVNE